MKKLSPIALGLAVKSAREDAKMLGNDLAKAAAITTSTLSRIENGQRPLEMAEAELVAAATSTTVDALLKVARRLEESGVAEKRKAAIEAMESQLAAMHGAALDVFRDLKRD